jgi:hypothetical protein
MSPRLERSDGRDIGDEVGNPEDQFSRIGVLQQLAADSQFDAERMWIRGPHLWLRSQVQGREGVEAIPQRPYRGGHLNGVRAHVIHDRVTEDVFLPAVRRNVFPPLPTTNANSASSSGCWVTFGSMTVECGPFSPDASFRKIAGTFGIARCVSTA